MSVVWTLLNQRAPDSSRSTADQDGALRHSFERTIFSLSDLAQQSALVVGAHPDDELIGAGAMLRRLREAGLVTATGGAPGNGRNARGAGFTSNWRYERARRREAAAALSLLQRPLQPMLNLGLPDQRVIFRIDPLVRQLMRVLRTGKFNVIITHPYEGGHPDHDAVALAVHAACRLIERVGKAAPVIVEMACYHLYDGQMVYGGFLSHLEAGPVEIFQLDPEERALKRAMMDCHRTQADVLAPFPVARESFRRAPTYDFLSPPCPQRLTYETYGWEITGDIWRSAAARALHALDILDSA